MEYYVKTCGQLVQVESATLSRCLSDTSSTNFDGSVCRVTAFSDVDLEEALPGDGGVFDLVDGRCVFGDIDALSDGSTGTVVFCLDEETTVFA